MVENTEIQQAEAPKSRGRNRRTSPMTAENRRQSLLDRGLGQIEGGSALANAPTTAEELVSAWKIPPHEIDEVAGVLMRQQLGTQIRDIIARIPVREFDLGGIAQSYGPGVYYFKGVPGPYETRIITLRVSPEFARSYGFGKIPEGPSASDHLAVRTLREVSGASGVEDDRLMAAIERAVERSTAQFLERMGIRPGTTPNPADPMAQFQNMETMLLFMDRLEDRAMRMAERRLGIAPKTNDEEEGGMMKTVNTIGSLLLEMMKNRQPAAPMAPQAQPAAPMAPQTQPAVQAILDRITAAMTEEEKQMIFPALGMLRPFVGTLQKLAAAPGRSTTDKAAELAAFIPDAFAGSMMALCGLKDRLGLDALELVGPGMNTPEWGAILSELARIIQEKYREDAP